MRVYPDVCCPNRPFDDQAQERIRRETEAILAIFARIGSGSWSWIGCDVLAEEVGRTPRIGRRDELERLLRLVSYTITIGETEHERAAWMMGRGFRRFDALHLACAEGASVDLFLTTDDQLLRVASRLRGELAVRVENPASRY